MNEQRVWEARQTCIIDNIRSNVCADALFSLIGRFAILPDRAAALSYLFISSIYFEAHQTDLHQQPFLDK